MVDQEFLDLESAPDIGKDALQPGNDSHQLRETRSLSPMTGGQESARQTSPRGPIPNQASARATAQASGVVLEKRVQKIALDEPSFQDFPDSSGRHTPGKVDNSKNLCYLISLVGLSKK